MSTYSRFLLVRGSQFRDPARSPNKNQCVFTGAGRRFHQRRASKSGVEDSVWRFWSFLRAGIVDLADRGQSGRARRLRAARPGKWTRITLLAATCPRGGIGDAEAVQIPRAPRAGRRWGALPLPHGHSGRTIPLDFAATVLDDETGGTIRERPSRRRQKRDND